MKTFALIFLFITNILYSQDTIRFKSGDKLPVKVTEVKEVEIVYKKTDNPDGPDYIVQRSELDWIRYKNGEVDTIRSVSKVPVVVLPVTPKVTALDSPKIYYKNGALFYRKKMVFQKDLKNLIIAYPDSAKKKDMLLSFDLMRKYKKKQRQYAWLSIPAAFGSFVTLTFAGAFTGTQDGSAAFALTGFASGLAIVTLGHIKAHKNKVLRVQAMRDIVEVYNGEKIKRIPRPVFPQYVMGDKLKIGFGKIVYQKRTLSLPMLQKLIKTYPDSLIKKTMLEQYTFAKKFRTKGRVQLVVAMLAPAAIIGGTIVFLRSADPEGFSGYLLLAPAGLIALGVGIPTLVFSIRNDRKHVKAIHYIADMYNQ